MSFCLLHIRCSKENEERGPFYAEPAIAALHALRGVDRVVSLEIGVTREGKIGFFVRGSERALQLAESQLYAQYPDCDITRITEDPFALTSQEEVFSLDLELVDPEVFPIKRHPQFDDLLSRVNVDPIAGITSSLVNLDIPSMRGHVQILMRPVGGSFRRRALRFLPLLRKGFSSTSESYARGFAKVQLARGWRRIVYLPLAIFMGGFRAWPGFRRFFAFSGLSASGKPVRLEDEEAERTAARSHDREDAVAAAQDKVNRLLFLCTVRVNVIVPKGVHAEAREKLEEIRSSFEQFSLPHCNAFKRGKISEGASCFQKFAANPYILSVEEIATVWHLPTILVQTPNLDWVLFRKLEPPSNLPIPREGDDVTVLGSAVYRGRARVFGLKQDDRQRHMYIIGKTGMGKSTLLENMVLGDIAAGRGVGVIDPHGDLVDAVLGCIPKQRSNDVILFDPADRDYPISFNMLECPQKDQRPLVASGIMSVFLKMWPDAWSGRMEHILRNTLLALLDYDGASMLGIMRMYADKGYREKVVARTADPTVRSFWEDEYKNWSENYRTEAIAAIQNKVGQLLSIPMIRNIIGQVKSRLDLRDAMDKGKIILVNLSKGKLGEDTSAFLGSMLVTKFQIDAMSRADIPEKDRRDFTLYVDEFQNFATETFATILSEARKYRLSLTMANQYISQLLIGDGNTRLRDAVFGNVGTLLSFQVGSDDAEILSLQFEEVVTPKDILSLPKYHAYLRLMIDGMPSKPFSVQTLPPPSATRVEGRDTLLRRVSRERYAEKREVVEEKILRYAAAASEARAQGAKEEKSREKEEEERKRAKKKGMSVEQYRKWRDREMWTNDFNALRKKVFGGESLTPEEQARMADLEKRLEQSGGVPLPSKAFLELKEKKV